MNFVVGRRNSPSQNNRTKDKVQDSNTCDLAAQAGVKVYSNLKQITEKPKIVKKMTTTGGAARKNFIQRNMTRSVGGRSDIKEPVG